MRRMTVLPFAKLSACPVLAQEACLNRATIA